MDESRYKSVRYRQKHFVFVIRYIIHYRDVCNEAEKAVRWCNSNMAISSQLSENRCVCEMSMSDVLYTLCINDIYFSASILFYIFCDVLQQIADVPMHICESLCECVNGEEGVGCMWTLEQFIRYSIKCILLEQNYILGTSPCLSTSLLS